jgi:hypothetical protein
MNSFHICIHIHSPINAARTTDTAHYTSCVSTVDDSEDNMNAGPGDKATNKEEEAALDVPEGNIQKKGVIVSGCFCINLFMI